MVADHGVCQGSCAYALTPAAVAAGSDTSCLSPICCQHIMFMYLHLHRYMDKGRDCIEQGKLYARLLGALGKAGLRV